MKYIFTCLLMLIISPCFAEESKLQWLDLRLSNYNYPYAVEHITINTQGQELEMAYMDINPIQYNGVNIVLLHGKNFNGAYWGATIEALKNQGYRVIVPDQIGFGKSSKPDNFQYSFQQMGLSIGRLEP